MAQFTRTPAPGEVQAFIGQVLSAMGFTRVTANGFSVDAELSVLTMVGAVLGQTLASVAVPS